MESKTMDRPLDVEPRTKTGVHVVTVTYNSEATLARFFEGLEANVDRVDAVTIVDNASSDSTVAAVERLASAARVEVTVVRNENTGFAGGYLAAARASEVPDRPVLCLNPDVQLAPGTIEAMVDVLDSFEDAGIVTAPLVELDGTADTASRRRLPTLGASMVYSVLGRLTPKAIRYNSRARPLELHGYSAGGVETTRLEATTGALMLVSPTFKRLRDGVFDADYWMYGEDLQLCVDAARAGLRVLMAEVPASLHVKGVSSGRPRSSAANRAFHDAMLTYARKNLVEGRLPLAFLRGAVWAHFVFTEVKATPVRARRALAAGRAHAGA